MKAIRVRLDDPQMGSRMAKNGKWDMVVKETNKYFDFYKDSGTWEVVEEFEIEEAS